MCEGGSWESHHCDRHVGFTWETGRRPVGSDPGPGRWEKPRQKGGGGRNVPCKWCKWACEVEEVGKEAKAAKAETAFRLTCVCYVAVIKCNNPFVIPVMVPPPSQGRWGPEILCLINYLAQCPSHSGGIGTGSLVFRDQVIKNLNTFYSMAGHDFQLLVQRPHSVNTKSHSDMSWVKNDHNITVILHSPNCVTDL